MSRILIADDIMENRYLLTSLLEGHGYEVVVAADGAEALALARLSPPDLLVTDIMMPVMDGFELCRRWKTDEHLKHIPLIVYTATYTDEKDERLALGLGADRFLIKPLETDDLLGVISEVLEDAHKDPGAVRLQSLDELELLRQHNDALLRKLQKKVRELEAALVERTRAGEDLRHTNALLDSVIENIPDMVLLKDARTLRYVRFNRAGEAMLGFSKTDLLGKDDYDLFPRDHADRTTQYDRAVLDGKVVVDVPEESVHTRHRGERILHTKAVPILGATGEAEYLLGISEDITERKQAEEKRRDLESQLQSSQKLEAIGRLAGGVAHDFNNTLSVILGYADFAINAIREGDPLRADLVHVRKAGERAAALTRQLLAFSRKQLLEPVVLNLNEVVTGIESMLRRLLGEDVEIEIHLDENLGRTLADQGQVEQILMNLAVNARDAMPRGGTLAIATANVDLDLEFADQHFGAEPGPFVMLSIADSGCGMDAETRARIFEPFFTTKEKGQGTGLGLATVYGIVKQSGGTIWVYSEPGHGTTFRVYLPRVDAPLTEAKQRPVSEIATGTETVLVVEDEDVVRSIIERMLRSARYRVLSAANGGEALLLCEKHGSEIDLLLTDVVMPQMGGPELVARIATFCPGLKTLYMSGYTDGAIAQHGVLNPGARFLEKPFSVANLTRKVREALDDE